MPTPWSQYRVMGFGKGLIVRPTGPIIPEGGLLRADNVEIDDYDVVTSRRGRKIWSSGYTLAGQSRLLKTSNVLKKLLSTRKDGADTKLYALTPTTSSLKKTWGGVDVPFPAQVDWRNFVLVGGKGFGKVYKMDALGNVSRAGLDAPGTAPTLVEGVAGVLRGDYYYRITFKTATQESSPGPESAKITVTDKQVNLSAIPTANQADVTVTARRIYRKGGSVTVYRLVAEIGDNITTTYVDNILDAATTTELDVDQGAPPECETMEVFKSRAFYASAGEQGVLYYSNLDSPEGVPVENSIPIRKEDGEKIVALAVVGVPYEASHLIGSLAIIKESSLWVLDGEGTVQEPWILNNVSEVVGTIASYSVVKYQGLVFFLSNRGVWSFDGRNLQKLSDNVELLLDLTATIKWPGYNRISRTYSLLQKSKAIIYRDRYILAVYDETAINENGTMDIYVLNLRKGAWTRWPGVSVKGLAIYGPTEVSELVVDLEDGNLYKMDEGVADGNLDISIDIHTGYLALGSPEVSKRLRHLTTLTGKFQGALAGALHFGPEDRKFDFTIDDCSTTKGSGSLTAWQWGGQTISNDTDNGLWKYKTFLPVNTEGEIFSLRYSSKNQRYRKLYGFVLSYSERKPR